MKKLLIVLMLVLTLALSGCEEERREDCDNLENYHWSELLDGCTKDVEPPYYTQVEVDALLQDLRDELEETYYTKEELDEGFEDVLIYLEELEQRIEDLETID